MKTIRIILIAACVALAGCGQPYPHQFKEGDILIVKLDGQRVQVTDLHVNNPNVRVRVPLTTGGYKYLDIEESALARP